MARLLNGINGPFSGKVGSIIGYVVDGKGYIKGHYKARTKKVTEKELLNREKFKVAQEWLGHLTPLLRVGFKKYRPGCEGFRAAKSHLMTHALEVVDGKAVINPERFQISYGNLPVSRDLKCEIASPSTLRLSWDPTDLQDYRLDQVMVLAYCTEEKDGACGLYVSSRDSGEYILNVETGKTYYVYFAFIAADRSSQSNSVYLGSFEF